SRHSAIEPPLQSGFVKDVHPNPISNLWSPPATAVGVKLIATSVVAVMMIMMKVKEDELAIDG
ncbi:hypothetical protein A2U01_0089220, partial [Trifolium medium]|nr:hypothetical protein [Trifolium medium]